MTIIGSGAFEDCSSLTSIILPNSVTTVGEGAFSGCSGLTSITLPENITYIKTSVFNGCSSLTTVTIPNDVISIWPWAFRGCGNITSIAIPRSVIFIAENAFSECDSLATITLRGNYRFKSLLEQCETVYYEQAYEDSWRAAYAAHTPGTNPRRWICLETGKELAPAEKKWVRASVLPEGAGMVSVEEASFDVGTQVAVSAQAHPDYTFIGWMSDSPGIGGVKPALTFQMPQEDVALKAYFAPAHPLEAWRRSRCGRLWMGNWPPASG